MTIQTPPNDQAPVAPETKDMGELSFSDYQKVRRGEATIDSVQPKSAPAAKAEQKKSEDSDISEPESKEEADESEVEGDEPEAKDDSEKAQPKKKSGIQRRVDKLNKRVSEAQARADYWEQQALKGTKDAPKEEARQVDQPKSAVDGKPNPEKYDTHAEYVEALTDWKIEQKEKASREASQKDKLKNDQEALMKSHIERVQAFEKTKGDFQEVIDAVDDINISPTVRDLILSSDNGPELMYELAKNRAEYERINSLTPLAAAREIGKIESKLSAKPTESKTETKKITSAPKPIEPVGSGKGHVAKSLDDPNLSFADYERLRRAQMKKRRA